jgi:hypothetical protein
MRHARQEFQMDANIKGCAGMVVNHCPMSRMLARHYVLPDLFLLM